MTSHHRKPLGPFLDEASSAVTAHAGAALSAKRGDEHAGDITAEIQVLASLRLQLDEDLRCITSEAREAGCSWHDIASALGVTTTQARRSILEHEVTNLTTP